MQDLPVLSCGFPLQFGIPLTIDTGGADLGAIIDRLNVTGRKVLWEGPYRMSGNVGLFGARAMEVLRQSTITAQVDILDTRRVGIRENIYPAIVAHYGVIVTNSAITTERLAACIKETHAHRTVHVALCNFLSWSGKEWVSARSYTRQRTSWAPLIRIRPAFFSGITREVYTGHHDVYLPSPRSVFTDGTL